MKLLSTVAWILITVIWGCQQNVSPSTLPEMQRVEGGTFEMGKFDLKRRNAAQYDNYPPHSVTLSDFWVSKYEITVGQYRSFCNEAHYPFPNQVPDWGWHDNHPMVYVSWEDANDYCAWLSQKTGKKYRLTTEAEWEYMAKGGSKAKQVNSLYAQDEIWDNANSNNRAQPPGSKRPNAVGVYDLNGNVQEWCQDYYHGTFYYFSPKVNPVCSTPHPRYTYAVIRGGSWQQEMVKVTDRRAAPPNVASAYLGFRCVLEE